ncbi:MAG: alkaline shock response membrane anchor protein AmaP [Candidatus Zapsychrus exili]|nr:alkaline shock response membrane anchor protein AmaP [Candidatus Zapsychrus exili]
MKFFTRVAVLFYVTFVLFAGCFLIAFVLQLLDINYIMAFLSAAYIDTNLRMAIGVIAVIILFKNFLFYRMFTVNINKNKVIAFDNPSGRVSVSLLALEDTVKRTALKLEEIKDLKSSIKTSKKGLQFKISLVLAAEVNIPEITSKVQELVKDKIQDMIGLDEAVDISIYVGKILLDKERKRVKKEDNADENDANIPFQGYRA